MGKIRFKLGGNKKMVLIKIFVYAMILCAIKFTITKIQKPREDITTTLLGERFIDYKIFSYIFLALSIGFMAILVFALSLPSNEGTEKNIVVIIFILVILFLFLMSLLYSRIYIKIGKNKIQWRKINGKEEKIKYEDITSYKVEGGNNLELYQEDTCVLNFPMGGKITYS